MAEAPRPVIEPRELTMDDDKVTEKLLTWVADKVYVQHLEKFATSHLLGIQHARYFQIIDEAQNNPWRKSFYVLTAWYDQTTRKIEDLLNLLREAEKLGFVQKGTHDDLVNGKVMNLEKCQTGHYPDFADIVKPWYTDPIWQNMLLFSWMDEEALLLSNAYTEMEMIYIGRDCKTEAIPLKDYKELFNNVKPEGTRILIKGDPGIGKTTFVCKLALDWATGNLGFFDVVFVIKLKFADSMQSIGGMAKEQIKSLCESNLSDTLLQEYLKSGTHRVLLVLDGLDEINLKQYPQVHEVLNGEAYRKCCILATTRPYMAEALVNKMTLLAKITGFSKVKAEKFIGHILSGEETKEFFSQLERRKMSTMYRVPIIVQALALLFRENKDLPTTYTITYDELVLILQKTSKNSKHLSEHELQEAMAEVNKLAYIGLTRKEKKLIFSRDEVKNDNIYKLGLLTAEKVGSALNPKTFLQFSHKTIQEHSAADHVVRRLENNDRGPWETIVQQYKKDMEENLLYSDSQQSGPPPKQHALKSSSEQSESQVEGDSSKSTLLRSALQKFQDNVSHPNINKTMEDIYRKVLDAGIYDDEVNFDQVSDVIFKHHITTLMNEEEKEVLCDFLIHQGVMETSKDWRAHQKQWLTTILNHSDDGEFDKYLISQKDLFTWIQNDPALTKEILIKQTSQFESEVNQPYQYITQDFTHLLEAIENNKTLFRFIAGKLSKDLLKNIMLDIAVLAIQHSFDKQNSGVLPFNQLVTFMEDLIRENDPTADQKETNLSLLRPALFHLKEDDNGDTEPIDKFCSTAALKISGKNKDDASFIKNKAQPLNRIINAYIAEIENISDLSECSPDICQGFTEALYQSPLVSLEIRNVDPGLVKLLTHNLPKSIQRLSISTEPPKRSPRGSFTFPQVVNLTCLYLEYCISSVEHMFDGSFPCLKKLSIRDDSYSWEQKDIAKWKEKDASALERVLTAGRMPKLEYLCLRYISLTGFGQYLADILKHSSIRSVDLLGTNLGVEDGKILLKCIQKGQLNHLKKINILNNYMLILIASELRTACEQHKIDLQITQEEEATVLCRAGHYVWLILMCLGVIYFMYALCTVIHN